MSHRILVAWLIAVAAMLFVASSRPSVRLLSRRLQLLLSICVSTRSLKATILDMVVSGSQEDDVKGLRVAVDDVSRAYRGGIVVIE